MKKKSNTLIKNLKLIKSFVESFSVVNEKFESNKYYGIFEINFNKNKILSFLRNKNIFHFYLFLICFGILA